MKRLITILMFCFLATNAYAITVAEGVVKKIKAFSATPEKYDPNDLGLLIIYVDGLAGACGTSEKRVAIGSNHPLFNAAHSIAMLSKTTNTKVSIGHVGTCNLRSNAWDFSIIELLE